MKPGFALSLSSEGITLLHRAAGGWRNAGNVPLSSGDLPGEMAALRAVAERIEPGKPACKLIIPNDQIRYLTIETGAADAAARQEMARAALEGATPYSVAELAFDLCQDGPRTHVAAVALVTLDEAETFAAEHGFLPASFVAVPGETEFLGEPFFGTARSIRGTEVEPDGIAVVDIGPAVLPPLPAPRAAGAEPAPAAEPQPEQPEAAPAIDAPRAAAAAARPAAAGAVPQAEPAAQLQEPGKPEPAADTPAAEDGAAPEAMDAEDAGPGQPVAGFSSRRQKAAGAAPALGGAARTAAAAAKPPSMPPAGAPAPAKPPLAAAKPVPAAPAKGAAVAAAVPVPGPSPAAGIAGAGKPQASGPAAGALPAMDAAAAQPRRAGLMLTAAVLIILALTAAWALWPGSSQPGSGLEQTQSDGSEAPIAPQVSVLPDLPDPGIVAAPQAAGDRAFGLTGTDIAVLDALRRIPEGGRDAADEQIGTENTSGADLPEPGRGNAELDPEAIADGMLDDSGESSGQDEDAQYGETDIWQEAPEIAEAPALADIDTVYVASIDHTNLSQDAVALPEAASLDTDAAPDAVTAPAAPGRAFSLDARGLVAATPEGTQNPDGVMVYLGRPAKVPPATPARPDPAVEAAAAAAERVAVLSRKRPRERPAGLVEKTERAQLGGLSRQELASVRPRARPASLKTEEQESQPATALAVARSKTPRARPSNFANLVDRAERRQPEPAAVAAAVPAAVRVTPSIPSSASVARQATLNNAINLRQLNLIGVYGTAANRRALVRLPNGRYSKVKVGDRIDGGQVIAIGEGQLQYQKRGRNHTLTIPNG